MAAGSDLELLRRIERAAIWAWPPSETHWIDGWLLCIGGAATRRLRSARTLDFAAGADADRAIERVEALLAVHGWPACFHIADLVAPPDLDAVVPHGCAPVDETDGRGHLDEDVVRVLEGSRSAQHHAHRDGQRRADTDRSDEDVLGLLT